MRDVVKEIRTRLLEMADSKFKDFHKKLVPSVDENNIIGIRVPTLRKYAKEIIKTYQQDELIVFMKDLPHRYYEENNLHGFLIEKIDDFDNCIYAIDDFLPFVDNWATCDYIVPKCFKKDDDAQRGRLLEKCYQWINAKDCFSVRFGIEQLMKYFLDHNFSPEYLDAVASVVSEEYYVNMMRAWYFATALDKQYDYAITYITNNKLDSWTHNKVIQKAIESKRVTAEHKIELKKYKIRSRI